MRVSLALFTLSALAIVSAPIARADDCKMPDKAPEMPQGASATEDEMREGRVKLQNYVKILETYEKCEDALIKNAPPGTKPEQLLQWQINSNAANDAAHTIADVYSVQLRAFKGRE